MTFPQPQPAPRKPPPVEFDEDVDVDATDDEGIDVWINYTPMSDKPVTDPKKIEAFDLDIHLKDAVVDAAIRLVTAKNGPRHAEIRAEHALAHAVRALEAQHNGSQKR